MSEFQSTLSVYLDGQFAGTLRRNRSGRVDFAYDHEYVALDDPTPLSMSVPLAAEQSRPKAVEAFLAGLLPDNSRTLMAWGRKYGVSPNNPFGLLEHVGMDTAGAVQILPASLAATDLRPRTGDIEWLCDLDMSDLVTNLAHHDADWDAAGYSGRWSLAGAQSKVALFSEGGRWGRPRDSTPTTHILKPSIRGFDDHDVNEYMCMEAASRLGLPAARCSLETFGDARVFVAQRYDRIKDSGGVWRRVHQEDICQALAVTPSKKYQNDGGPGVGEIADLFGRLSRTDADDSLRRVFDSLVFNVAIGPTDGHAKNYSVLHRGRRTLMAPLYDLASILPYDPSNLPESAMRIGNHRSIAQIGLTDFIRAGRRMQIPAAEAESRAAALRGRIAPVFHAIADELERGQAGGAFPRRLADRVEANVERRRGPFGDLAVATRT